MKKTYIDIYKLLAIIIRDKKKMITYCCVSAVISIIVAFSIPRIYKSSVMLAPEETSNGFSGNISSLASMVGMNMKFGTNGDAIYPEIYPDAMSSTEFLTKLFFVKISSKDGKIQDMPYWEYLQFHQKSAWWNYPTDVIRNMIEKLKGENSDGNISQQRIDPFRLTKKQYELAKAINNCIDCHVDKKTNVITITVTDQDPVISATLADSVRMYLQAFITDYRTNKARNDEAFMEQLLTEAEIDYKVARDEYAAFCDANRDARLQSVKTKIEDLENNMQLRYNIYSEVVSQLQMARAKVQERTPAFTVLQNAYVPVKHSNTPKIFILMLFVILAAFIRLVILIKHHHKEIIASL